ncbi:hypothetical protein [Marinicella sp. W31]|uniref:hypothetical protein n=1 Tax=Marinicella sp. W31 TaxID=3023713 RepID=UPI003756E994
MKKMLFAIGVCASMLVQGQDLILDDNTIPLDENTPLTINPNSGDIVVSSENGNLVCVDNSQANAPTLTLSTNPTTFTSSSTNVTVSWSVSGADTCFASNAWSGAKSSSGSNNSEVLSNVTQTSIYELTCSNSFGSVQKSAVVAKTGTITNPTPLTLSMSASPTSVIAGGQATISWTLGNVASGATCTASGAWSGSKAAQTGNNTEVVNSITPPATFTLSCQNPGTNAVVRQVTVNSQGSAQCSSQPPIALVEQTAPNTFQDGTNNIPWGEATGVTVRYGLSKFKYSALDFVSPSGNLTKKVFFENGRPADGGPANYTVAISECPGDFSVHLNQNFCKVSGSTPTLRWTTDPAVSSRCTLEKNKQYYLNIVHSLDEANGYTNSICPDAAECGVLFSELF